MSPEAVQIICAVLAAFSAVMVAVVNNRSQKAAKRAEEREEATMEFERERDKREEKRSRMRQRETMLILQMLDATAQLSDVSANALTNGHNNGNVERAREAFAKATEEYEAFKREVAAEAF